MTEMKKICHAVVIILAAAILSWFLPWLYALAFPSAHNDPFVAYSPVNDSFIVSENDGSGLIFAYRGDDDGDRAGYTREERDSLLPQIYFNQLTGRGRMPDTIAGRGVTVHDLKQSQWVFSSLPRDINRVDAGVYLLMESMPARFDLEDPQIYFTVDGGRIRIADIETGETDVTSGERFTKVFEERGLTFPIVWSDADITSRKPYDDGYMLIDSNGSLFHLKMQVGRPYMVRIDMPGGVRASHAFIMENADRSDLALVTDTGNNLYVVEREGYRPVSLPVGKVDVARERLTVVKNMFNWVVKINGEDSTRWVALDSDTYEPLGCYVRATEMSDAEKTEEYLFPFALSFTSVNDCYVMPRFDGYSAKSLILNLILAAGVAVVVRRRGNSALATVLSALLTAVAGLFAAIPLLIIKN